MVHTPRGYPDYWEYFYPLQLDEIVVYCGVIISSDSPEPIYTPVFGEMHSEGSYPDRWMLRPVR